jgi:methionyl-tRNA formyltransferase
MTRVIFMGSPSEVLGPLRALIERAGEVGAQLVGVVSQPARPAGRGGNLMDPPVASFSKQEGIVTLQPESAKDPAFLHQLSRLAPDVIVTAAYGQILSDDFLKIPRIGTINIHPSMLPAYRGATPVPAALLDGLKTTGVSILFTVKKLDAGNIILQKSFEIGPAETAGELTQRLFSESSGMLLEVLDLLGRKPDTKGVPQEHSAATFCKKIAKEMGEIDWSQDAGTVYDRFRAFQPWPGSFTRLADRSLTVVQMTLAQSKAASSRPGSVMFDKPSKSLIVSCGNGSVHLQKLKPAGGKEMDAASFWNGLRDRESVILGENR